MTDKTISGTDSRENDRLLPCPFCGGEARLASNMTGEDNWVMCKKCGVYYPHDKSHDYTETAAIKAWNTRAKRTCENVMPRSYNYLECSLCGALTYQGKAEFNYCPNCGAKVVDK